MPRHCLIALVMLVVRIASAQNLCPTIPSDGMGFQAGVQVHVYISSADTAVSAQSAAIAQGIAAWAQVNGVTYNISYSTQGYTPSTDNNHPSWLVISGPVPAGKDAYTVQTYPTLGQPSQSVVTYFRASFLQDVTNGNNTAPDAVASLASHETVHPNWEADCIPTQSVTCDDVSANGNGNTVVGPSVCDITAAANNLGKPASSSEGLGTGAGSTNACAGEPPTCSDGQVPYCNIADWVCEDSTPTCGTPSPCDGAVCVNGGVWDSSECTSVSTCQGDPGTCGDGEVPQCINDTWSCPGEAGCTDACNQACSNYNYCSCYPDDPSCSGQPTCDPDGDICDPDSCNYDEFECECGYSVVRPLDADPNDLPARRTQSPGIVHPDCKVVVPAFPFLKRTSEPEMA